MHSTRTIKSSISISYDVTIPLNCPIHHHYHPNHLLHHYSLLFLLLVLLSISQVAAQGIFPLMRQVFLSWRLHCHLWLNKLCQFHFIHCVSWLQEKVKLILLHLESDINFLQYQKEGYFQVVIQFSPDFDQRQKRQEIFN